MATISRRIASLSKFLHTHYIGAHNLQNLKINKYSTCSQLIYSEFGDPIKVVQQVDQELEKLTSGEVLIKMWASPVNPADINTIQGRYPSRPTLPAVAGNEGVGEVVEVGPDVYSFSVGDRVIPLSNNAGTWRTYITLNEMDLFKVPTKLGILEAATLKVNPCTAYRMLSDFVVLKPGDTVIQNGANSACGQYIIQLCNEWQVNTVNIVRDRDNIDELKSFLKGIGATHVLTEEELRSTVMFKEKIVPKPCLALNCVGGKNALEMLRHLESFGTMVTYGGMSREPVTVPTSALIFKDVQIRGFWMTRWGIKNANSPVQLEMFEDIIKLMTKGKLLGPVCEMIDFNDYKQALENTMNIKGMVGKKYVLRYP